MRCINLLLSLTSTLSRTPTCDGKTDGRTQGHSIYPALRACKGKSIIGRFTATFLGPFCPEAILAGGCRFDRQTTVLPYTVVCMVLLHVQIAAVFNAGAAR